MAHAPPGSARVRLDTHTGAVGLLCRQPCPPGTSSAALRTRLFHVYRGQALTSRALPDTSGRSTRCWRRKCLAYVAGPEVEAPKVPSPPTYVQAPGRIVAIGDIHGDLQKTYLALTISGVYKPGPNQEPLWCGGNTTIVQLGDVLDRGDREIGVIMLLRELDRQARREGGAVYMLNGNHESLNLSGNYRYATLGGMLEAARAAGLQGEDLCKPHFRIQARTSMYAPGQPMALELAKNPTVLVVNDTLFAHGGVLPNHVQYGLEKINAEVAAWMRGDKLPNGRAAQPPFLAMGCAESVMWNRSFGKELLNPFERYCTCTQLKHTLTMLGLRQLVVGHTPQTNGANCECNGQVWRMDVGMSGGVLNAVPQVLEINRGLDGENIMRLLRAPTPVKKQHTSVVVAGKAWSLRA